MLISFSGFDGSGKTTQIQLLLKKYHSQGLTVCSIYYFRKRCQANLINYFKNYDVIHARFRLNSDINNEIMKILEYSDFSDIDLAKRAAAQGYNDYIELYQYVITPLMEANKIIISDRHYYDEIAFKTTYGCRYSDMVHLYANVISPNIAFYIDIQPVTAISRNNDRPDGQTTIYKSVAYTIKIKSMFDKLSNTTNLIRINGERPVEVINSDIISTLSMFNSKLSIIIIITQTKKYFNKKNKKDTKKTLN